MNWFGPAGDCGCCEQEPPVLLPCPCSPWHSSDLSQPVYIVVSGATGCCDVVNGEWCFIECSDWPYFGPPNHYEWPDIGTNIPGLGDNEVQWAHLKIKQIPVDVACCPEGEAWLGFEAVRYIDPDPEGYIGKQLFAHRLVLKCYDNSYLGIWAASWDTPYVEQEGIWDREYAACDYLPNYVLDSNPAWPGVCGGNGTAVLHTSNEDGDCEDLIVPCCPQARGWVIEDFAIDGQMCNATWMIANTDEQTRCEWRFTDDQAVPCPSVEPGVDFKVNRIVVTLDNEFFTLPSPFSAGVYPPGDPPHPAAGSPILRVFFIMDDEVFGMQIITMLNAAVQDPCDGSTIQLQYSPGESNPPFIPINVDATIRAVP